MELLDASRPGVVDEVEIHIVASAPNPSISLINTPTFKEIFLAGSPPEDYFPLGWISYGTNPPHLKEFFWGGSKICRQASCFACGDAKLQHLRDLQPIVFNRESIQGHGPTIAEPCIPYCGGGGGGGPPINQKLGLTINPKP